MMDNTIVGKVQFWYLKKFKAAVPLYDLPLLVIGCPYTEIQLSGYFVNAGKMMFDGKTYFLRYISEKGMFDFVTCNEKAGV